MYIASLTHATLAGVTMYLVWLFHVGGHIMCELIYPRCENAISGVSTRDFTLDMSAASIHTACSQVLPSRPGALSVAQGWPKHAPASL